VKRKSRPAGLWRASFQCNGLLRTYFLTAKTGNACVSIRFGYIPIHEKSGYRTLINTSPTGSAQLRINLGSQKGSIKEHSLDGLIVHNRFAAEGRYFEIRQWLQFSKYFNMFEIIVP
jgi:hypothetical protein